jgi:gamma-glutamyltranspeptidase/glutathione hydrolase
MGRRAAVATNHPRATAAGELMLRSGGNAFDAAAAVSFALSVVEPHMSGLGGDAFFHIYDAKSRRTIVYNGSGAAPRAATLNEYRNGIPSTGPKAASTPGFLGAVFQAHTEHGRLRWEGVCTPAIEAAEDGFAATENFVRFATKFQKKLMADANTAKIFLRKGEPPEVGSLIYQPALARTLRKLAREGAEDFYRGELAKQFCLDMIDVGALITDRDIRDFAPEKQDSIAVKYRGYNVLQTPPNSSGFVLLQALKVVERFDLAALGEGSAELLHILVEAKKLVFLDRERFSGDPHMNAVPLEHLLSEETADRLASLISLHHAASVPIRAVESTGGDTTYFCVVDGEGNAVSGIQSLNNPFGSGVTAPRTGILLNNRMVSWHLEPEHANVLQPGKRVRHTMNAPFILRDGRVWAVFGTPGADSQIQVNLQAVVSMIDLGIDPQLIAEAPRWNSDQIGQDSVWPHDGSDTLSLEEGFPSATLEGLSARGHTVKVIGRMDGPCSLACIRVLDNGVRMAGSDPRWDGWAAAF